MSTKPLTLPNSALYEQDYAAWADETGRLIRAGRLADIDLENLAEEVEAMAGRDRRELLSRMTVLIHHMLKWTHQPERRSKSWRSTIRTQRNLISRLLRQSPSLRPAVTGSLEEAYEDAVQDASIQTGLPSGAFPRRCPFNAAQILDQDFLPK